MTTDHDGYLELAAAAIDFTLSQGETEALAGHLAGCVSCRRRVTGLHADQLALTQLPMVVLPEVRVERVSRRLRRRGTTAPPALRLVGVAALLALLAITAIAVGAELMRRDRDSNLSVVNPVPTASAAPAETPSTSPPPSSSPPPSANPTTTPRPGTYAADTILEVVATGLRVRTEPTVDDTKSAKLEPLLGPGTQLRVIDGPVTADDYDWYLVQAIGWPHRGWVAAADHDGAPWIEDRGTASSPAPTMSTVEASLMAGLRSDAAVDCAPRRTRLPSGATAGIECHVNAAVVVRIGAYRFADARAAATTYFERLDSYRVDTATGDCPAGKSGDAPWMSGDGMDGTDATQVIDFRNTGPWVVGRSGCFLDENGVANVRATCGSTYVGVLGRDKDLADVYRWTWAGSKDPVEPGDPPGICAG